MTKLSILFVAGGDDMFKEAGDGEGADAADDRGDGGEVGAFPDFIGEIAF